MAYPEGRRALLGSYRTPEKQPAAQRRVTCARSPAKRGGGWDLHSRLLVLGLEVCPLHVASHHRHRWRLGEGRGGAGKPTWNAGPLAMPLSIPKPRQEFLPINVEWEGFHFQKVIEKTLFIDSIPTSNLHEILH